MTAPNDNLNFIRSHTENATTRIGCYFDNYFDYYFDYYYANRAKTPGVRRAHTKNTPLKRKTVLQTRASSLEHARWDLV